MSGLFNAIASAIAPPTDNTNPNTTTGTSPIDSTKPVLPPTAQTSEFINAGSTSPSSQNYASGPGFGSSPVFGGSSAGFGGGLASNPNVPRPGTSINPETGKPHTAGLTRAELQAIKDKGRDLLDDSPQSEVARRGVKGDDGLEGLSGREQAAAQLAAATASTGVQTKTAHITPDTAVLSTSTSVPGVAIGSNTTNASAPSNTSSLNPTSSTSGFGGATTPGAITPGLEMPGAWGPVKTAPLPGTGPNAPASVYEDVAFGLEKVGLAAYNIIPQSLKEVISPNVNSPPTSPSQAKTTATPRSPTLAPNSPNSARRASLLDQAKAQTNSLLTQAQQTVQSARKSSVAAQGEGLIKDVKGFFGDVVAHTPFAGEVLDATPKSTSSAKTSLPSQEPLGAQPGDKTAGVGALPGKLSETGVAVLPDEKKPVRENQGQLPGEVAAFGYENRSAGSAGPSGTSRDVGSSSASGSHGVDAFSPPKSTSTIPKFSSSQEDTSSTPSSTVPGGSSTTDSNTGSHAVAALEPAPSSSTIPEPAPVHDSESISASRDLEPATTPSVDLLSMPATALALETLPEPKSSRDIDTTPQISSDTPSEPVKSQFIESLPEAPQTNSFANTSAFENERSTPSFSQTETSSFTGHTEPNAIYNSSTEPTYNESTSQSIPHDLETASSSVLSTHGSNTQPQSQGSYGGLATTGASYNDSISTSTPRDIETASSTAPSTYETNSSTYESNTQSHSHSHSGYGGLAAPLPATFLGTGAAHGATDLETVKGISTESAYPSDANGTGLNPSSGLSASTTSGLSGLTPPANDRTTSLASVTAIRDGHEGERSSGSLAKQALGASALASVAEGQRSTTRGTGPEHTTSLTPGNVEDGVGHPSSRTEDVVNSTSTATPKVAAAPVTGTTAENTKPAVRDEQQPTTNTQQTSGEHARYPMEGHDQPKSNVFGTGKDTTGHEILKHDGVLAPEPTTGDSTSPLAASTSHASAHHSHHGGVKDEVEGHHRTGSTASVGADGKKKSGFLGKLKDKLHHR